MSDTPRTDALIYRKNTIEMQRHELLDLALALERELVAARAELAEAKEQLRLCNVDQFTTAAELAEPAIKESLTVQRPWVGLTENEIWTLHDFDSYLNPVEFARAIEAKLREKNT